MLMQIYIKFHKLAFKFRKQKFLERKLLKNILVYSIQFPEHSGISGEFIQCNALYSESIN